MNKISISCSSSSLLAPWYSLKTKCSTSFAYGLKMSNSTSLNGFEMNETSRGGLVHKIHKIQIQPYLIIVTCFKFPNELKA